MEIKSDGEKKNRKHKTSKKAVLRWKLKEKKSEIEKKKHYDEKTKKRREKRRKTLKRVWVMIRETANIGRT